MSLKGLGSARHLLRGKINNLDVMALSAYDIAVKNGYTGTEEEWLLSLQGGAVVDDTLSVDGVAADAKATGEGIRANAAEIVNAKRLADNAKTSADNANTAAKNAQTDTDNHTSNKDNPHNVTPAQLGLGKVNDTADIDKPVSTLQAVAIEKAKTEAQEYAKAEADKAKTAADNAQTTADEAKNIANAALPRTGGVMTGNVTLNGITLTEGVDYGTELPTPGKKGRLFFKVVE